MASDRKTLALVRTLAAEPVDDELGLGPSWQLGQIRELLGLVRSEADEQLINQLIAENTRLENPLHHAERPVRTENRLLLSAAREMREVLREVEWQRFAGEPEGLCPMCRRYRDEDHAPDCRLARLIGGGE